MKLNLCEVVLEAEHPHEEAIWLAAEIHQIDLNTTKKAVGNQGMDECILHLWPLLCTSCTQLQKELSELEKNWLEFNSHPDEELHHYLWNEPVLR